MQNVTQIGARALYLDEKRNAANRRATFHYLSLIIVIDGCF